MHACKLAQSNYFGVLPNVWPFFVMELLKWNEMGSLIVNVHVLSIASSSLNISFHALQMDFEHHLNGNSECAAIVWWIIAIANNNNSKIVRRTKPKTKANQSTYALRMKQSTIKLIREVVSYICHRLHFCNWYTRKWITSIRVFWANGKKERFNFEWNALVRARARVRRTRVCTIRLLHSHCFICSDIYLMHTHDLHFW